MYYVMLYGGLLGFLVSLIGVVYVFLKKDITECIKHVFKLKVMIMICGGMMVLGSVVNYDNVQDISRNIVSEEQKKKCLSGIVNNVGELENIDDDQEENKEEDDNESDSSKKLTLTASEEEMTAYIFENENEVGSWTNSPVKLKLSVHDDNAIKSISIKIGEEEEEITDYTDIKEESEKSDAAENELNEESGNTDDNVNDVEKDIIVEQSTISSSGVPVEVKVINMLGEISELKRFIHVDTNGPEAAYTGYENDGDSISEKGGIIYSKERVCIRFAISDVGSGVDGDSIKAMYDPLSLDLPVFVDDKGYYTYIPAEAEDSLYDGCVVVYAKDMAGNVVEQKSERVVCCSILPEISWTSDYEFGKWSDKDITIHIQAAAKECGIERIAYYVAGKKVLEEKFDEVRYTSSYDLELDKATEKKGGYTVEVKVTDNCGNAICKKDKVYIDKEPPKLTLTGAEDGVHYAHNVKMKLEISDVSFSDTSLKCAITRVAYGKSNVENREIYTPKNYTDFDEFVLSKEGEYRINISASDGAGNRTVLPELNFVIDKTSPEIYMGGIKDKTMKNTDVKVEFVCEEIFYGTNEISINVKRSMGGKSQNEKLHIFDYNVGKEVKYYTFSQEGEYEITMNAKDKAGNEAQEEVLHFTVDKTAPAISYTGTTPYKQWDRQVEIRLMVKEEFIRNNKVSVKGYVSEPEGNRTELFLPQMKADKKTNYMTLSFDKDGIYEISVNARDGAGNVSRKDIRFLIDTKAPEINGIDRYDGKYLKELDIKSDKECMFSDLTLKICGLMLNGIEYSGLEKVTQEGKYILTAYAEDELGHRSETSAQFVIDHSAPDILFIGIKDGDTVYEPGVLIWRTYDADDSIIGVNINGKEYDANRRELSYNTYGTYDIEIESIDKAGNEGVSKLSFEYAVPRREKVSGVAEKSDNSRREINVYILMVAITGFVVLVFLSIHFIRKKQIIK